MPVNASNNNLGMIASDFNLLDVSGRYYDLNSIKGENGTVVAFICNHCPYVKAIAKNLSFEANELKKFSINVIAIMSNDVIQYPDDSFENMKIFSKNYNFNFYYLYDDTQQVAKKYGAVCTPDFFGFNQSLKLMYRGRIDSSNVNSNNNLIQRDLYNAMIQIYKKGNAPKEQINSIGCSIKWKK